MIRSLARGNLTVRRYALDFLVAALVAAAILGLWVTYDRASGWEKFGIILGAALIYSVVARQPEENLGPVVALLSVWGTLIAIHLLLAMDWRHQAPDLQVLWPLWSRWGRIRPAWPFGEASLNANIAAGQLAVLLPFTIAGLWWSWQLFRKSSARRALLHLAGSIFALGIMSIALLMSSSRGAWLALTAGLSAWLLWEAGHAIGRRLNLPGGPVFLGLVFVLALSGWVLVQDTPGGLLGLADRLPGLSSGDSRLQLATETVQLALDTPFTGAGLRAFPGVYSVYERVTPYFIYAYSHNLYLDVLFELGVAGLVGLLLVLTITGWLALQAGDEWSRFEWVLNGALVASLAITILHGLVDDPLYGEGGSLLLFLLPAMAAALHPPSDPAEPGKMLFESGERRSLLFAGTAAGLVILAALGLTSRNSLFSSWYANLGAVEMARVHLVDFPSGEWKGASEAVRLGTAEALFEKSISYNPSNSTARYRLGWIAMLRRDYPRAVENLEIAYSQNPDHRGIRKSLGYSYLWTGQIDQGVEMLSDLPEVQHELSVYVKWWQDRGRGDLADLAKFSLLRLRN